jgi:hypothetical protein
MTGTRRSATAEKPTKPVRKRVSTRKTQTKIRQPDHSEIAERAYFIHLHEGGGDELGNWLRAERELIAV